LTATIASVARLSDATSSNSSANSAVVSQRQVTTTLLTRVWRQLRKKVVQPIKKNKSTFSLRYLYWRKTIVKKREQLLRAAQLLSLAKICALRRPSSTLTSRKISNISQISVLPGWARFFKFSTFWKCLWSTTAFLKGVRAPVSSCLSKLWPHPTRSRPMNHGEFLRIGILSRVLKSQPMFSCRIQTRNLNTWLSTSIETGRNGKIIWLPC